MLELFQNDYNIVQFSQTEFRLVKVGQERLEIVEFMVDETEVTQKDVYSRLYSEITYNIGEIELEEEDFETLKPRHYTTISRFLEELQLLEKLIREGNNK